MAHSGPGELLMGEIADMMIQGQMCQTCGVYLGDGEGFPTECTACKNATTKDEDEK